MSAQRDKILLTLDQKDYRALFMECGCQFYALALGEQFCLPLFYASLPGRDDHSHVFAMNGRECWDYEGKRDVAVIAEKYAGWPDESPRSVSVERIREVMRARGIDDLESSVLPIAHAEICRRRHLYA